MKQVTSLSFKKIAEDDFYALALLRHNLWPQDTVSDHLADINELFSRTDHDGFIAYQLNDKKHNEPCAFIELTLRPYVNGCLYRPVAFIEGYYHTPSSDGQTCEQALHKLADEWAIEKGAQELATDAYLDNHKAQDDCKRLGFQPTEKIVYFRKKL